VSKAKKAQFGMLGLGVMGQNLALNIERNGYTTAVWDREPEEVEKFIKNQAQDKQILGARSILELIDSLERPRKIMMMIKAGEPVDWTIDLLKPHLQEGDIIIDGGNSQLGLAFNHGLGDSLRIVRIIHRICVVSPEVQNVMSLFFEQFDDLGFQGKTRMIGPNGYAHLSLLKSEMVKARNIELMVSNK